MNREFEQLVRTVYTPPYKSNSITIASLYGSSKVYFYSLARFALLNALKILNWQPGDKILVPEYICRDLLAPLNMLKAEIIFYATSDKLEPIQSQENWPTAKAVIAVNYFGLPQNIAPFEAYKQRTGAVLIEDNAHGFLSRDSHGQLLGTRGDIGLLSIRKSIPIYNGGALLLNKKFIGIKDITQQTQFAPTGLKYNLKNSLRQVVPLIGPENIQRMTTGIRKLRKLRYGYEINLGDYSDEYSIPGSETPVAVDRFVQRLDLEKLVLHRVELYKLLQSYLKPYGAKAVIDSLPKNCVPYVFPFYSEPSKIGAITEALRSVGLECFAWPSLPKKILPVAPVHYTSLYCVRFQW